MNDGDSSNYNGGSDNNHRRHKSQIPAPASVPAIAPRGAAVDLATLGYNPDLTKATGHVQLQASVDEDRNNTRSLRDAGSTASRTKEVTSVEIPSGLMGSQWLRQVLRDWLRIYQCCMRVKELV